MGFYVAAAVQATQHSIIRVLDAEKQVGEVKTLPAIIDLIVRPSDDMLIVGFANGAVKMLALDGTITPITSLVGLTMMALSDSGQFLALGNADGAVEIWDLVRDWKTQTYRKRSWFMHRGPVTSLAFVVGPALVLSGGTDELLYLWDALDGKTIQCCEGHSSEIVAISTTGRGCMTAGGPGDNSVKLWDLDNRRRTVVYTAA
jgi:WD40 repeat protein